MVFNHFTDDKSDINPHPDTTTSSSNPTYYLPPILTYLPTYLPTNINPRETRIMITRLTIKRSPRINMYMLISRSRKQFRTHIHLIERLTVHIEEISIPFLPRNPHDLIDETQTRGGDEPSQRIDKSELVEIPRDDHRCVAVFDEDPTDEFRDDLVLSGAVLDAVVEGRSGVAVEG